MPKSKFPLWVMMSGHDATKGVSQGLHAKAKGCVRVDKGPMGNMISLSLFLSTFRTTHGRPVSMNLCKAQGQHVPLCRAHFVVLKST